MKVLKQGIDPKTIPIVATCTNCKTQVEFTKAEAKYTPAYDQRDGEYWSVACPVCQSGISATGGSRGGYYDDR